MGKYGSKEIVWKRFDGGLVLGVDGTEIDDDQAADCANVDFRDFALNVRRGQSVCASVAVAEKVRGIHRYYKRDGTRKLLVQAGDTIYEDNGSGALSASSVTTLTGGVPFDFIGYREQVYAGSSADALLKRAEDGTWTAVTPVTPPTGLTLTPFAPVWEAFDSQTPHASNPASGWVWNDDSNIAIDPDTDDSLEGGVSLVFTFNSGSVGDHAFKNFSYGPADLSKAESLAIWYQASQAGRTIQIGIAPNNPATTLAEDLDNSETGVDVASTVGYEVGDYISVVNTTLDAATDIEIMKVTAVTGTTNGTLTVVRGQYNTSAVAHTSGAVVNQAVDWAKFGQTVTTASESWQMVRIALDGIPPERRTAASAIGVRFVAKGKPDLPFTLKLDQLLARGPHIPDSYQYSVTYAVTERSNYFDLVRQESNPYTASLLKIELDPPSYGVQLVATGSPASDVNVLRFWRYRNQGPFRLARLIGTAPKSATAIDDATNISATDTAVVVDSVVGYSPGCVITCESEKMLVTAIDGATRTLTVRRGYYGSTAATHADNTAITFLHFLDQISDGELALEDAEELSDGRITPPKAASYALANGSLYAGNVTIDGTNHPWRLYKSRSHFPDEFRQTQDPQDAASSAGWLDLPTKDYIRRLVEFDGSLLIFCDRSIWSLEGSGWDDFSVRKRADVGLDAREAVCVSDRLIYFLSADGIRVLAPNQTSDDLFPCWVISEPVDTLLRAIPATSTNYRANAAMGVDERGRIHCSITRSGQTVNDATLVFDPHAGGLGEQAYNSKRRGWTYFTQMGFSCYTTLKRGSLDAGQLVGGNAASATAAFYLQRSSADADLRHDGTTTINDTGGISDADSSVTLASALTVRVGHVLQIESEQVLVTAVNHSTHAVSITRAYNGTTAASHADTTAVTVLIPWHWQSKALDAGPGAVWEFSFLGANCDAAANQGFTFTPVLDGAASATTYSLSLGSGSSGFVSPETRLAPSIRGRHGAVKLSGVVGVALRMRDVRLGLYSRGS